MVELTKSVLSFSWAQSLFGTQQFLSALAAPVSGGTVSKTTAAFNAVAWSAEEQLGDVLKGVYGLGDLAQRGAVDAAFDLLSGKGFDPGDVLRQTGALLRQAFDALRFLAAGEDLGLAWQEFVNKLRVFRWVRNVETLLHLPADGGYVPLTDLVDRAYALGAFPALWAVEGAGHYYAVSQWGADEDPRDLLSDARAAVVPDASMTMLHAGIGLAFADRLLQNVTPDTPGPEVREVVRRFLNLCRANSRPGYDGAALESLGLVARVFHPQALVPVIDRELAALDEEALAYFWHGVGRAIYFSPTYFLPFGRSPWRAVELCDGEAPHELGRLNAVAGLAWAVTLVNMLQPQVMETVVRRHGEEFLRDGAFAHGLSSSIIVRYDTTPAASFITAFCRHRPGPADPVLGQAWDMLVRKPCETGLGPRYDMLKKQDRLGEVFHYRLNKPQREATGPS